MDESELYYAYLSEYESNNLIKRYLFKNFYHRINQILRSVLTSSHNVFEIGCGPGESSDRISKMLYPENEFIVTDYDVRHINMIRKLRPHLNARQADVLSLTEEDNEFDLVIMLEVLEHISDFHRALEEVFRVSRRYVLISVPREPLWRILNMLRLQYLTKFGNTPDHKNHWSTRSIIKLLNKYGKVVKCHQPLPWSIMLVEKIQNK